MELLDIYDELGNYIGTEDRNIVHRDALWHKTIHCWLYDKEGNVFFQIRADRKTLYTTSSGHLKAGESISEGFAREIKEEIGIDIDSSDATKVEVVPFKMDRIKSDGSIFRDRAFANVYVDTYEGDYQDFNFDENEVLGLVKVKAKDTKKIFKNGKGTVKGLVIKNNGNKNVFEEKEIDINDFLVNDGETLIEKYGKVLDKVIELT